MPMTHEFTSGLFETSGAMPCGYCALLLALTALNHFSTTTPPSAQSSITEADGLAQGLFEPASF